MADGKDQAFAQPVHKRRQHNEVRRSRRVLVVDDDPGVRTLLEECLGRWGYEVDTAIHGADGVRQARNAAVDLVITNYLMPGLSGIDVSKTIRSIAPDLPIILISGYELTDIGLGNTDLFDGFLMKPFELDDLKELLTKVNVQVEF